jgi:hypothetical protein
MLLVALWGHSTLTYHTTLIPPLQTECPCGATSEPALSSTFIYPIYVTELRYRQNKTTVSLANNQC